ncbi:MAG: helix-turn-helix transcriptional regulator [Bdellovibrionota bacterium]
MPRDLLDQIMAERAAKNPCFPELAEAAYQRRKLARELAEKRESLGASQTAVAALMRTSPSVVSKLESGADTKLSTLQKYAQAMGLELNITIKPRKRSARKRPSPQHAAR